MEAINEKLDTPDRLIFKYFYLKTHRAIINGNMSLINIESVP